MNDDRQGSAKPGPAAFGEGAHGGLIRGTFRHAAVYSGATLLGRLIGFIMLPFYTHILRGVGYGVIGMIDAGMSLIASLLANNFGTAILRIYHEEPDPARKPQVVSTGTILVALIVLPLVLVTGLLSRPLSDLLLGTGEYWHLICLALATFYVDLVVQTALRILLILRRSGTYSLIGLFRLVFGLSLNILLVVILRWDLFGYFLSQLLVAVLSLPIALWLLWKLCGYRFDRELAGRLLRFQLPLIPGSFVRFFSQQIERVVVRYKIDLTTVGILEMAYKFPVLIQMLITAPFHMSWATKAFEIADQPHGRMQIGRVFSYYMYLIILGSLLLAVNIRSILELITPPEFWSAYRIARIDTMQVVVHGAGLYLAFGLTYAKRTGMLARLTIITSVIKVILSYILISRWGLFGAAWSGLLTAAIYTLAAHLLAQRHYRLQLEHAKLGLIVGYALALFLAIESLSTEAIAAWGAPWLGWLQGVVDGLRDTWLGRWKDGKVLDILGGRSDLVLDLTVRTALSAAYLAIMPLVHVETQMRIGRRLAGWRRGF